MSKRGFTQAEVLIALIVIGVIAALTIPNILENVQDAQFKAAFKRNYSMLDQATKRLVQDNGGSLAGIFTGDDNFRNTYLQYFSYIKTCNDNSISINTDTDGNDYILSNCWSKYNYYLNKNFTDTWGANSQVVLSNGASLSFLLLSSGCDDSWLSTGDCGTIEIDVNGPKSPNKYGKDIFFVLVGKNSLAPIGGVTDTTDNDCDPNDPSHYGWGYSCSSMALQNKDY